MSCSFDLHNDLKLSADGITRILTGIHTYMYIHTSIMYCVCDYGDTARHKSFHQGPLWFSLALAISLN